MDVSLLGDWRIGGMNGAPLLSAKATLRSGSGYVRVSTPGGTGEIPSEIVGFDIPTEDWEEYVIKMILKDLRQSLWVPDG